MNLLSKKYILTFIVLVLSLLASSCNSKIAVIFPNRPGNEFDESLAEASVEFEQGWRDGCEVGASGGSNTFYKMFYKNNVSDGYKIANSRDYKSAWGNAFWYCYRHDFIKQDKSIWAAVFGGYK